MVARLFIVNGFLILVLIAGPLFLIALGLGWALRGMGVGLYKLTFRKLTFRFRASPIPQ